MSAMKWGAEPLRLTQGPKDPSRRDFLTLAGKALLAASGVLALGELIHFLSFQPDPAPRTRFDLGTADQYPVGSRTLVTDARAVLVRTASGFTAYSLVCPHLGCTLNVKPEGFACPCHGSKFSLEGELINGPASRPMQPLPIEVTSDGKIILCTG